MTIDELVQRVLEILPESQILQDNYGQIVIYTGLVDAGGGLTEPFVDSDEDDFDADYPDPEKIIPAEPYDT